MTAAQKVLSCPKCCGPSDDCCTCRPDYDNVADVDLPVLMAVVEGEVDCASLSGTIMLYPRAYCKPNCPLPSSPPHVTYIEWVGSTRTLTFFGTDCGNGDPGQIPGAQLLVPDGCYDLATPINGANVNIFPNNIYVKGDIGFARNCSYGATCDQAVDIRYFIYNKENVVGGGLVDPCTLGASSEVLGQYTRTLQVISVNPIHVVYTWNVAPGGFFCKGADPITGVVPFDAPGSKFTITITEAP